MNEYSLPIDEPTDEAVPVAEGGRSKRMPGQRIAARSKGDDLAVVAARPAPESAPRCLNDIPAEFRRPAKPPVKKRRDDDHG